MQRGRKISYDPTILIPGNDHILLEANGTKISYDPTIRLHYTKIKKNYKKMNMTESSSVMFIRIKKKVRRERERIRENHSCVQILVGVKVHVSFDRYSQDLAYTFICKNVVSRAACPAV